MRNPTRMPVWVQDALLALVVAAMQVQGVQGTAAAEAAGTGGGTARALSEVGGVGYLLLVMSGLALAARRRWPVAVFVVAASFSVAYYTLDFPDGPVWIALFVAIYTVTAHGDGHRSLVITGVGITVLAAAWLTAAADIEPREAIGWVFFRIGASVMSAALGESARSRRVIAAEASERAERAERSREEEARSRVDAERLRIAREVHDTVAHAIAIINVQAGVTAHVLDKRPERARETLLVIEHTSSQALREMRAVLGVLRDEHDGRVPHQGLEEVDELIVKARDAGLDITLVGVTPDLSLPSAVSSAAYRILQEAITNVIRHVGPTRVTVSMTRSDDVLEIRATDDGPTGSDGTGSDGTVNDSTVNEGRGIVGMRERCELLGGELYAGPRHAGFEVTARLPLEPSELAHS